MKKTIFISCGQYSEAEKHLGKSIAALVRAQTSLTPFFAQEVQDLNGLDTNILKALRDCVAFITVLHPRGAVVRPDREPLVRGSVWIEQEIAIATYIQRVENRQLPIIAFKHRSVGREGIRDLLHLNPIEFTDEAEILSELPSRLQSWNSLKPTGIELKLNSWKMSDPSGHTISQFELTLVNDTNKRIEHYDFEVIVPARLLTHWNAFYPLEKQSANLNIRCFRSDQDRLGAVSPHDRIRLMVLEYCLTCAQTGDYVDALLTAESTVSAKLWAGENEYFVEKTIKQLAIERT